MPPIPPLHVLLNDRPITILSGTTIAQMLALHPHPGTAPAIGAVVDNRIGGLNRAIQHAARITTIDTTMREGMEIYRRTAGMIFYAALARFDPEARVVIGQSIDDSYFFEPIGFSPTAGHIARLEEIMRDYVGADLPLDPVWTPIEEAIQIFERLGRQDRVLLLRQMRRSDLPLLTIDQYIGYVHGPVAPQTGLINHFRLHPYASGLLLQFPGKNGEFPDQVPQRPKLFATYMETKAWQQLMGVANVARLNEMVSGGTVSEVVLVAEALHEKKIAAISDTIKARRDVRFLFIAGPSSSGKTTFSKRLAIQLQVIGLKPVALSMDNYYRNRENSPLHPDGSYDFESVEALDLGLFNTQLQQLLKGALVETPIFSFPRGRRIHKTHPLQLHAGQVILIEGIHALNPRIAEAIPRESCFKIFVSALTQICIDDHNRIFTSDCRLIRRIVRDWKFRGTNAAETITIWPSVRAGEERWIYPFQEDADVMFDSALCYEQAVLKNYAERYLTEVPNEHPSYVEALRLFRFLDLFVPLQSEDVPHTSILREFIGRSAFRY
ncbi:MAG: nucleoside kinase [Deltaproteobacteria bacterium]|nr:nucleoside kinase [Deltaproteobacteria bacterium]